MECVRLPQDAVPTHSVPSPAQKHLVGGDRVKIAAFLKGWASVYETHAPKIAEALRGSPFAKQPPEDFPEGTFVDLQALIFDSLLHGKRANLLRWVCGASVHSVAKRGVEPVDVLFATLRVSAEMFRALNLHEEAEEWERLQRAVNQVQSEDDVIRLWLWVFDVLCLMTPPPFLFIEGDRIAYCRLHVPSDWVFQWMAKGQDCPMYEAYRELASEGKHAPAFWAALCDGVKEEGWGAFLLSLEKELRVDVYGGRNPKEHIGLETLENLPADNAGEEGGRVKAEYKRLFYRLLQTLPQTDRQLLQLMLEGKTQEDIARLFGITPSAVQKRFNRLRHRLRHTPL